MSEKLTFYQVDSDGVKHEVDMEATGLIIKPYVIDSDGDHDRLLMGNHIVKRVSLSMQRSPRKMNDNQKTLMHYLIDIYLDRDTLDLLHVGDIFIEHFFGGEGGEMPAEVYSAYNALSSNEVNQVVSELALMANKK